MSLADRLARLRTRLVVATLGLAACGHSDPFVSDLHPNQLPLSPAEPIQLTYNPGEDQYPSWLPDGSGILYSFVEPSHGGLDRCMGVMPAAGGQVGRFRCPDNDPRNDSLDIITESAARADGRIAWVEQHNLNDRQIPDMGAITLGSLESGSSTVTLQKLPYVSSSGRVHQTAAYLRWLPGEQLAYIGTDLLIRSICFGCKPDTIVLGREMVLVDASGRRAPLLSLPGTAEATSIWPTADSSGVYYTLAGDTRVWLRNFSGGLPQPIHDFGGGGIVRDVSVVGDRLAAIVGGKVNYGFEQVLGLRQVDSGGMVMTVDLISGTERTYVGVGLFRRAVLSPDGHGLVVERVIRPATHPDLWLFQLP